MNEEQRRQQTVEIQMACAHDPQPVAGMPFIKRCSECGKIFGKNEFEMIDLKREKEESK